jgi:nucleotide-binding universal stress UspA family protein
MFPIHTILHPTDFSDYSTAALRMAEALARDYGARLVVLHVMPPPPVVAGEMGAYIPELEDPTALWDRLNALQPEGSICVERFLVKGEPATEIVNMARGEKADLLVMGTHGRSGLGRLLMGSVAEWVMRKAPCPVLTVKMPVGAAREAAAPQLAGHT